MRPHLSLRSRRKLRRPGWCCTRCAPCVGSGCAAGVLAVASVFRLGRCDSSPAVGALPRRRHGSRTGNGNNNTCHGTPSCSAKLGRLAHRHLCSPGTDDIALATDDGRDFTWARSGPQDVQPRRPFTIRRIFSSQGCIGGTIRRPPLVLARPNNSAASAPYSALSRNVMQQP
jgi:hypothetical protein